MNAVLKYIKKMIVIGEIHWVVLNNLKLRKSSKAKYPSQK